MKKIFVLFFIIFTGTHSLSLTKNRDLFTIHNLNESDKNFVSFKRIINNNQNQWQKIKNNYQISKLPNLKTLSIAKYVIQNNDNIFSIAEKLNLVVDTLISFNSLASDLSVHSGDTILIPSMDGVVIFPSSETTTTRIARIYNVQESLLLYVNSIFSSSILAGEEIFIPFARLSDEEKAYFMNEPFIYPLDGGHFTSSYGKRFHPILHRWAFHGGVDIGTPIHSRVYAAAEGKVIHVAFSGGYGNLIVIQHKYGYTTWYGHLSKSLVSVGQNVSQRDLIAYSGNTGQSTGPHLHFEIRRFNLRENPMKALTFDHHAIVFDPDKEKM